ncbi:MAG: molybdopterin molybdotransferase MoeA [Thermovirgaceae bacterium]|nr:molybdopterin molybdotransferase MoeA [Thermovirgaceae bacterium]
MRTLSREEAIGKLAEDLGFPWVLKVKRNIPLEEAIGFPIAKDLVAQTASPPFSRSLRDGYAVRSGDLVGASESSPVFLSVCGEVPMGMMPDVSVPQENAALVHTGGAIPFGADAVIMLEDISDSGKMIEVRKSVQVADNILLEGEEFERGHLILRTGEIVNFRNIGSIAACGFHAVDLIDLRVAIISTGDEIVPAGTVDLPPGKIRDSNSAVIMAQLYRAGIRGNFLGIAGDDPHELGLAFNGALESHDVVLLSGGSSVSVRDHSVSLLKTLGNNPDYDLPVRGLNISPGKPTIASGDAARKKLAVCLPGHPHSCSVVTAVFLIPLLRTMYSGKPDDLFRKVFLPASSDIIGKNGVEEFIPVRIDRQGEAFPLWGKSGYVLALDSSDGFIRLPEEAETVRRGKNVEVWLW